MNKFAVFSGFLGAGKTTAMMALTEYYTAHYGKAAMISNDLGHGVDLADNRLAQLRGCNASELTDQCICYQHPQLAQRLDDCFADGCALVVSDIPGFGVGALEHVYHGMTADYPGRYALAPFTVLVEPKTVDLLRSGEGGDLGYIYDAQLLEADLIVLNKCDLLTDALRDADLAYLAQRYPSAQVLALSALTGEGMDALARALRDGKASMRRPDLGCGGADFRRAMGTISEFYFQYHAAVCCNDFDGDAYLLDIAQRVQAKARSGGWEIPHLKLLAWEPEGDYGKADLLGADRPVEQSRRFTKPCTQLAVILNASAACPAKLLNDTLKDAVYAASTQFQLELTVFKRECFGMG